MYKGARENIGDFMFLDEVQANLDQTDRTEVRDMKKKVKDDEVAFKRPFG